MTDIGSRFRHSILAAQRSGHRVLADLIRPLGLTPAWAEVLTVLSEQGPLSIRELSRYLICEADHPSRLITRIEDRGLIRREPNPTDKRAVLLSLTEEGMSAAAEVRQAEAKLDAWIEKQLPAKEMEHVSALMDRLLKNTSEGQSLKNRYPTMTAKLPD